MPRSLKLEFSDDGLRILHASEVSGVEAENQLACLNVGTLRGSDPIYPTRGTDLLRAALQGGLFNPMAAYHAANFAAIDTVFFLAEYDPFTGHDPIGELKLQVTSLSASNLELNMWTTTVAGVETGVDLTL